MKNKLLSIFFYDREKDSRLSLVLHWLVNLAFIGLWSLGIGIVSLYFGKVNYGPELFSSYFQYTGLFLLNIIPGALVALLFLLITNRVWPAVLASGAFVLGLGIVNHFKLMFRDDPLLAADIVNIAEAANISGGYTFTLTPALVLTGLAFIAAVIFAAFFMKARFSKVRWRIVSAVLLIAAGAGLYCGAYTSEDVYDFTNNLGVEFASGYKMSQWNETDQYCCRGFMYPLIHSTADLVSQKPEGYDRGEAESALAELGGGDIAQDKKVNIISIMLEAYCDLSVFDSIEIADCDPYEFFHELQGESVSGSLITNIFAGGTINTERAFLSGSTVMYEYRAPADSFVRYLDAQGYYTEFCHPGYDWFYNRRNVAEYLGFEASYFNDDRYQMPEGSGIMRDDSFLPDLIELYEQAEKPYFNFSVTYQNHGPYADGYLYDSENVYIRQNGMSDGAYNIISNYLWGIKLTDDSLREFFDYFRSEDEPVVIVLFGDHKPWLGDNSSVYAELGIDLSRGSDESFYNYYETPYIIWANDAAREVIGSDMVDEGEDISPCFLMQELFDRLGWEGDGYMNALRSLRGEVSVVNSSGRYMADGVLTGEISAQAQEKLSLVEDLQYYRMKHAMN